MRCKNFFLLALITQLLYMPSPAMMTPPLTLPPLHTLTMQARSQRAAFMLSGGTLTRTAAESAATQAVASVMRVVPADGAARRSVGTPVVRQVTSAARWLRPMDDSEDLMAVLRTTRRAASLLDTVDTGLRAAITSPDASAAESVHAMLCLFDRWQAAWTPLFQKMSLPVLRWIADAVRESLAPAWFLLELQYPLLVSGERVPAAAFAEDIANLLPQHRECDDIRYPIKYPSRVVVADLLLDYLSVGSIDRMVRGVDTIIHHLAPEAELPESLQQLGLQWPPDPARHAALNVLLELLNAQLLISNTHVGAYGVLHFTV